MDEKTVIKTAHQLFIISLIVCVIVSLFTHTISYLLGIVLGYGISLIVYEFNIRMTDLILDVEETKLTVVLLFIGKLLLYGLGLFISMKFMSYISWITVFIGYLLIRIAIYKESFIERRKRS